MTNWVYEQYNSIKKAPAEGPGLFVLSQAMPLGTAGTREVIDAAHQLFFH